MNPPSSPRPDTDPAPPRKKPVRPAFRPFRAVPSTDPNPYRVEAMPRFWRWHCGIFAFTCLVTIGLSAWRGGGYYWLLPLVVGISLGWQLTYRTRCPQCRRLLRARQLALGSDRYLYMYDCSDCRVSWNSQYIQDPTSGG